jgi:hypothetical protein
MRECRANLAGRCGSRGLMGPAVLVTLGILFLLANRPEYPFARTWPILLIVIGAVKVARYTMSEAPPRDPLDPQPYAAGPYPQAGEQMDGRVGIGDGRADAGLVTPPLPPPVGAEGASKGEAGEVIHG